jgi:hypothetical protein
MRKNILIFRQESTVTESFGRTKKRKLNLTVAIISSLKRLSDVVLLFAICIVGIIQVHFFIKKNNNFICGLAFASECGVFRHVLAPIHLVGSSYSSSKTCFQYNQTHPDSLFFAAFFVAICIPDRDVSRDNTSRWSICQVCL